MRYIEAPKEYQPEPGDGPLVYLAGGITGTDHWQPHAARLLLDLDIVLLNPRRRVFPLDDDAEHARQVSWEHRYLHDPQHRAELAIVWFAASPTPAVTQPIVWYELGRVVERGTPLVVGADPGYVRRRDVIVQLALARPDLTAHTTLEATLQAARETISRLRPDRSRTAGVRSRSAQRPPPPA